MGGMNQNSRYGAPAAAASHHSANLHQQGGMGFASLPEYQYPSASSPKRQQSSGSYSKHQHNNNSGGAVVAPRHHQLRPRQNTELAAAAPQQQQPAIESPTVSQGGGSENGSSHSSQQQPCFHYNPYDTQCSRVTYQQAMDQQQYPQFPNVAPEDTQNSSLGYGGHYEEQQMEEEAPAKSVLPYGTLHGHLEGYVSFVPYPTEEFVNPNKTAAMGAAAEGNMSRVFLGQLPYQVTDMQLDWLCYAFGNGGSVYYPERITKHDSMRGCKVPTGCIHAYAENDVVSSMLSAMHKRILVDDTGVWYAETPAQQSLLNDYCLMMKNDRTKRYQNRPYDTVVSQFATSSFVRRR